MPLTSFLIKLETDYIKLYVMVGRYEDMKLNVDL